MRRILCLALAAFALVLFGREGGDSSAAAPDPAPALTPEELTRLRNVEAWDIEYTETYSDAASGSGDLTGVNLGVGSTYYRPSLWSASLGLDYSFSAGFTVAGATGQADCSTFSGPQRCVAKHEFPASWTASYADIRSGQYVTNCGLPDGSPLGSYSALLSITSGGSAQMTGATSETSIFGSFVIDYSVNPPLAFSSNYAVPFTGPYTIDEELSCFPLGDEVNTYQPLYRLQMFPYSPFDDPATEGGDTQIRIEDGEFVIRGGLDWSFDRNFGAPFVPAIIQGHRTVHAEWVVREHTPCKIKGAVLDGDPGDGHSNPLHGVPVQLLKNGAVIEELLSEQNGRYEFRCQALEEYVLKASLEYEDVFEVRYGASGAEPVWVTVEVPTTIDPEAIIEQDIVFSADLVQDSSVPEGNRDTLPHIANIAYRSRQFVDWATGTLSASMATAANPPPLNIYTFGDGLLTVAADGAVYYPSSSSIYLGSLSSLYLKRSAPNSESPENGEWHEIAHHLWQTNITTAGRCLLCSNHGGYSNPGTADSMSEGFGVYMGAVAWRGIEGGNDSDYDLFGDLESNNWKAWTAVQTSDGSTYQREDFAVAALLWDLMDAGSDDLDTFVVKSDGSGHIEANFRDEIALGVGGLWQVLKEMDDNNATVVGLRDALYASTAVPQDAKTKNIDLDGDDVLDISLLDIPFILHGFFPVDPGEIAEGSSGLSERHIAHGHYWVGTEVGRTDHVSILSFLVPRHNLEEVPGANLRIDVLDANGNPLAGGVASITVEYPHGSTTIDVPLGAGTGNLVHLEVPPYYEGPPGEGDPLPPCDPASDYMVTVTVVVIVGGVTSTNEVVFDNCEYWLAVAAATEEYALPLEFSVPLVGTPGSATPTVTASPTPTPTATVGPTATAAVTATATGAVTAVVTPPVSGSGTATPTPTPTVTPTVTVSASPTVVPGGSQSPSATSSGSTAPSPTVAAVHGDANCDGEVGPEDLLALLLYLAGVKDSLSCAGVANVDCSAGVDVDDLWVLLLHFAGFPQEIAGCPGVGEAG